MHVGMHRWYRLHWAAGAGALKHPSLLSPKDRTEWQKGVCFFLNFCPGPHSLIWRGKTRESLGPQALTEQRDRVNHQAEHLFKPHQLQSSLVRVLFLPSGRLLEL